MLTALTRGVSPSLNACELEYQDRVEIDIGKAAKQHREYEGCLSELGLRVISLPADPDLPDGVFVEDPAVVVEEVAIMTRLGAGSRRKESASLAEALAQFRPLKWMRAPATLEGGDVIRVGKTLYVGISRRTNREGAEQLAELLAPFDYRVVPVRVEGCLHLKSACSHLGDGTILANRQWIEPGAFSDFKIVEVPPEEPSAANVLLIGETVLMPASFPRTRSLLNRFQVRQIDVSELQKAEAGVTCTSIILGPLMGSP